ncbi:MAG: hypothetical protein H0Z38_09035 [Firmicutes bacterium]|nr:hypothetical protein [Bacillota bacterium]
MRTVIYWRNGHLDAISKIDRICDDIGVDIIEMGVSVGMAIEGGLIPWSDADAAIFLLDPERDTCLRPPGR